MKYESFQQIITTMEANGHDYKVDCAEVLKNLEKRKNGIEFSFSQHISTMVFAELSNQRPWKPIADNADKIKEIFHGFDADYLKKANPNELTQAIIDIHCGNRQIAKQMATLKDNIETLERIANEYGSIDKCYNSLNPLDLAKELSYGPKYKLKQMGLALVSEYIKGVGVDVIKPDVHVNRILGRLGYTEHSPAKEEESYKVCREIADEYGISMIEVDTVLWQFGASDYSEICAETPKCGSCLVKNCKMRINPHD